VSVTLGDLPAQPDGDALVVAASCSGCGIALRVRGQGRRISDDGRSYEADGVCVACGAAAGLIRVVAPTLFGLHEDEAVLRGRARVYEGSAK
jgi:hypothetical protein